MLAQVRTGGLRALTARGGPNRGFTFPPRDVHSRCRLTGATRGCSGSTRRATGTRGSAWGTTPQRGCAPCRRPWRACPCSWPGMRMWSWCAAPRRRGSCVVCRSADSPSPSLPRTERLRVLWPQETWEGAASEVCARGAGARTASPWPSPSSSRCVARRGAGPTRCGTSVFGSSTPRPGAPGSCGASSKRIRRSPAGCATPRSSAVRVTPWRRWRRR